MLILSFVANLITTKLPLCAKTAIIIPANGSNLFVPFHFGHCTISLSPSLCLFYLPHNILTYYDILLIYICKVKADMAKLIVILFWYNKYTKDPWMSCHGSFLLMFMMIFFIFLNMSIRCEVLNLFNLLIIGYLRVLS